MDEVRQDVGWQPIESAPAGVEIQARIPGHGEDNVIAWQADAFMDSDDRPCGGWAFTRDQEPPDCWTDGVCWEVNEDGHPSVKPTHWKSLPSAHPTLPEQLPEALRSDAISEEPTGDDNV